MLMVQNNSQLPMKTSKLKAPPPVPPRPNQSVVAEALAKTRKAVFESRANLTKSRNKQDVQTKTQKAKTLERTNSTGKSPPKQNGLARVKSFIRDVINDRSSSSDEKKSSGTNSRRSSSDSSSTPSLSIKKSTESLNTKVKSCRQILVRSLSTTSSKIAEESKSKVTKSSSFAEKTLPLRKAPPPPLSPKPKLRPMKPLPLNKQRSLERSDQTVVVGTNRPQELALYSSPIDAKVPPQSPVSDAYATVVEAKSEKKIEDRLHNSPVEKPSVCSSPNVINESVVTPSVDIDTNSLERKTSQVTEMLISEILASRNKQDANAVIDKGKDDIGDLVGDQLPALRKDMSNHEMLIYELQTMRSQSDVPETVSVVENVPASLEPVDHESVSSECSAESLRSSLIQNPQEGSDYADPYACIDDNLKSRLRKQFRAISSMSLHGLPPLPKSLSGFTEGQEDDPDSPQLSPTTEHRPLAGDLDGQLDYLKKEMASLRQLDLSLLSELWSLSEAMGSWRRQLERGVRLRPAPPPPLPPHYLRT